MSVVDNIVEEVKTLTGGEEEKKEDASKDDEKKQDDAEKADEAKKKVEETEVSIEQLEKQIAERQAELDRRLEEKRSKEREERIQTEIVTVIKLEREKLEQERMRLVEERIRYEVTGVCLQIICTLKSHIIIHHINGVIVVCLYKEKILPILFVMFQEILQEMKESTGKGSRKSTGSRSPQSIAMQRVDSDQNSNNTYKSEKQRQLEEDRAKLEREKAEFEEWKKRFLNSWPITAQYFVTMYFYLNIWRHAPVRSIVIAEMDISVAGVASKTLYWGCLVSLVLSGQRIFPGTTGWWHHLDPS